MDLRSQHSKLSSIGISDHDEQVRLAIVNVVSERGLIVSAALVSCRS